MTETQTNKRGWVKNAAIIFLAVLLLLTFFSNTILNRSLPEIAGYYAQSGTITTRISGTGTVEAVDSFAVEVKQPREVQSVAVRVGDSVNVGDVLFYLSGAESDELDSLTDQLFDLQIAYSKAVIQKTGANFTKEERAITQAREELESLQADLNALTPVTAAEVSSLKAQAAQAATKVVSVQDKLDSANYELEDLKNALNAITKVEGSEGDASAMDAAELVMSSAKATYDALLLSYEVPYNIIKEYAESHRGTTSLDAYMMYLRETEFYDIKESDDSVEVDKLKTAYDKVTPTKTDYESAKAAYNNAVDVYQKSIVSGNVSKWNRANNAVNDQQYVVNELTRDLAAATKASDAADKEYTHAEAKLQAYETDLQTAQKAVRTQQNTIDDLVFDLSEQQKQAVIDSKIDDLDLQAQSKKISDLAADIAEMQADGTGSEIVSSVAGVVRSVNISSGKTANPGESMMDIDIADRGYTMSFAVTTEQAKNLQVGTQAEVSMNYWSTVDVKATLSAIRTDPQNPTTSRLLMFEVEGDTSPGASLRVSVGQKSQNFETVVPNSAVKTDSNGDFVLMVEAKASPLSTRYIARRIDVTVLAKDDLNSAVSGALTTSDFVITTSSKPIEAGMQVKMPE